MLGRTDWIPARAEPVSHRAFEASDSQDAQATAKWMKRVLP